jgi:hypothetical protein
MLSAALLFGDDAQLFLITLTLVGSAALAWKLLGPLAQALARRIEGRSTAGAMTAEEAADLRNRMQDLESHQARLLELEERLDFAERVLVRQREQAGRVGPGAEP